MLYVLLIIIIFLLIKLVYFNETAINKRAVRRFKKLFTVPESVTENWKRELAEDNGKLREKLGLPKTQHGQSINSKISEDDE